MFPTLIVDFLTSGNIFATNFIYSEKIINIKITYNVNDKVIILTILIVKIKGIINLDLFQ